MFLSEITFQLLEEESDDDGDEFEEDSTDSESD